MTEERKDFLQKQIFELLQSEEICAELLMCANAETVKEVLGKCSIDAMSEEIAEIYRAGTIEIKKVKESKSEELDLEKLDEVVGGNRFWRGAGTFAGGTVFGFGLGIVCGVCPVFTPNAMQAWEVIF